MTLRITIEQHTEPISVRAGETILAAALRQGVAYPHGCQSGSCGACKSRLIGGEVEMSPYSQFALSEAERGQGLILACRSVPREDAAVAWLQQDEPADHPLRHLDCRVTALDDATHDIRRLRLEIAAGGPYNFSAGQFAQLTFDGQPPRDYSMASRPTDEGLEFHVRRMDGGVTSLHVSDRLKPGDAVRVDGPYGISYLRRRHTGPIIAVAGGSGMAPISSIVESALAAGMTQPIHLFFGVRDERDVYDEARLKELAAAHSNFAYTIVLSEPSGPTERRSGMVHEAILGRFTQFEGCKVYLAGPPLMVNAATALLFSFGMDRRDIHADPFYTAAERAAQEAGR